MTECKCIGKWALIWWKNSVVTRKWVFRNDIIYWLENSNSKHSEYRNDDLMVLQKGPSEIGKVSNELKIPTVTITLNCKGYNFKFISYCKGIVLFH